jgi:uncharacterized protein
MELHLRGTLMLRCDRCGREMSFALDVQRRFFFVSGEEELALVEIDESPEEALVGSVHFDLSALIEDEAILQLPLSPRHADCEPAGAFERQGAPERPKPFAGLEGLRERLRETDNSGAPRPEGAAGAARPAKNRKPA